LTGSDGLKPITKPMLQTVPGGGCGGGGKKETVPLPGSQRGIKAATKVWGGHKLSLSVKESVVNDTDTNGRGKDIVRRSIRRRLSKTDYVCHNSGKKKKRFFLHWGRENHKGRPTKICTQL